MTFETTLSLLLDCIDRQDLDRSTATVEKVRLYNHLFCCKPLYISRLTNHLWHEFIRARLIMCKFIYIIYIYIYIYICSINLPCFLQAYFKKM